jgi:hypothetical protein
MGVRKILMLGEASLRAECAWVEDPISKDVGALVALEENWRFGMEALLRQLASR